MKLYYAPISTYSQKVLMALYEKEIDFTPMLVNLQDEAGRAAYCEIYPLGKIPAMVLDDGHLIPESSTIVEYLDTHFDSGPRLIPADPDLARQVRFKDRMMDLYVNDSVANLIFEGWKPEAERSQELIERCTFRLGVIYRFMEQSLADNPWMNGAEFSLSDCAAAGPMFYAQETAPFSEHPNIAAYWERLRARPSFQKVLAEAAPMLEQIRARSA